MKDIKRLLKYVKPYYSKSILFALSNAFSVIFALFSFTMLIPFLRILFNPDKLVMKLKPWDYSSGTLIHNMLYYLSQIIKNQGVLDALLIVSIIVIIATFFKTGFFFLGRFFMVDIKNSVQRDLMKRFYEKIVLLPMQYYSEQRKGNLLTRMTSDINEVKNAVENLHSFLLRDPIMLFFYVGYMFYTSFKLTLFVLVFLPLAGYIIIRIAHSLRRKSYLAQQILSRILSISEETITGLRIIKAFNAEEKMFKKFKKIISDFYRIMNKVERRIMLSQPMSEFLGTVIIVVILYFGGSMILLGKTHLTSEMFITYLVVFSQAINPAKSITKSFYNIQKGLASLDRIEEVFKEKNEIRNDNGLIIRTFKSDIELRNVSFSYGDKYILKNINLKIKKGQTVAIVGESGAGKSTLVDLLPRFYEVHQGEILIDGVNIKDINLKALRDLFGIVNQQPILFNDTIEYNITFGVEEYTQQDLIRAAKIANAYDFIMEKEKGFATQVGEGGSNLSGGQKQRISIARAVMKNPPILILDEATSSLDTESEFLVQQALNNLMKGKTSIVIAHRLSTVKNADVIYVLNKGRIVEQGTHKQLIALNGYYKKLVDMQDIG